MKRLKILIIFISIMIETVLGVDACAKSGKAGMCCENNGDGPNCKRYTD